MRCIVLTIRFLPCAFALNLFVPPMAHAFKTAAQPTCPFSRLHGRDLPALVEARIVSLSGFSCRAARPEPLLFQTDERNSQGHYVAGEATGELARDESPGVFDENDESVFMAAELGERCSPEALERVRGKLIEVEITGDNFAAPGYVYLLQADRGYVPTRARISFDEDSRQVRSSAYTIIPCSTTAT